MEGKNLDIVSVIMVLVALFTIILQIFPPKTIKDQVNSIIYFIAIIGYISLLYGTVWISKKVRSYIDEINNNKQEIQDIKDKMNTEKKFNEIDKRLSILEFFNKNRKGQIPINPKWFFLIILLVLFYLYLRSLGILP